MTSNGDNNDDDKICIMGGQVAAGIPLTMKRISVHGWRAGQNHGFLPNP